MKTKVPRAISMNAIFFLEGVAPHPQTPGAGRIAALDPAIAPCHPDTPKECFAIKIAASLLNAASGLVQAADGLEHPVPVPRARLPCRSVQPGFYVLKLT